MKKLVDLYGYFAQRECPYYIEDSWNGRVLVKEDGTLEGIATDYDRVRKFFLFGTINEKNLRIIRTTINDREIPKMYKAKFIITDKKVNKSLGYWRDDRSDTSGF